MHTLKEESGQLEEKNHGLKSSYDELEKEYRWLKGAVGKIREINDRALLISRKSTEQVLKPQTTGEVGRG